MGTDYPGPMGTAGELDLANLIFVHWPNQDRLHRFIGGVPPVPSSQIR